MKKILFSLLMVIATAFTLSAQTGLNGINYQAVARNTNGTILANQQIKVKISILGGNAGGTLQYQENHSLSTNQLGLFTLQIGKGSPATGVFANVPWQNTNQFLKVELAIGGGSFSDLGTTQLMSVPYALFAANSNPGSQGPAGAKGEKGDRGDVGLPGVAGAKGDKGDAGATGAPGIAGTKGNKGESGDAGLPGSTGAKGDKGDKGDVGAQGPKGDQGLPGIAGASGLKGDKGENGDQGIQGLTGAAGTTGANGTDGASGLKGEKGEKGDQGIQGLTGAAGTTGANGTDGAPGIKGDKGDPGAVGTAGAAGVTGPIGPAGPKGDPGDITTSVAGGDLLGNYPNPTIGNDKVTTSKILDGSVTLAKLAAGIIPVTLPPNGTAGGDLGGTYPNPKVVALQSKPVSNTVPVAGQYLKFDGTNWMPSAVAAGAAFTLPYEAVENSAIKPLFSIKNTSGSFTVPAGAIMGESSTGYGVYGKGTDDNGLGVFASSEKHIGLWATTNSPSAAAGYFYSPNTANTQPALVAQAEGTGAAIYGGAKSGTGIIANSETGPAAKFELTNVANFNNVVTVKTGGSGFGVAVETKNAASIWARSNAVTGGTIDAINVSTNTTSTAILGSNENGIGVKGVSNAATGFGVVASGNTYGTGLAAYSNFGPAAKIYLIQPSNANTVLDITTAGAGTGVNILTQGGSAIVAESASNNPTVWAKNTVGANNSSNYAIKGTALGGVGVYAESFSNAGLQAYSNTGRAGFFILNNPANGNSALKATTVGAGPAVEGEVFGGRGVYGHAIGGIGVFGESETGTAGIFRANQGTRMAIRTFGNVEINGKTNVVSTIPTGSGGAAMEVNENGAGIAGFFNASNVTNPSAALVALNLGSGAALIATSSGTGISGPQINNVAVFKNFPNVSATPINVARIDNTGKGFFNGGTQNSGADIAEAFDVAGNVTANEPGDILVISQDKDRAVEKSSRAYSNLVAGVYATKPGVLLTEEHIDTDLTGKVPMGVLGVIPTKVCLEGGAIKRGDMLVTSSLAGVAMKADLKKVKIGEVLGKALEAFDGVGVQKIKVLVSIK